MSAKVEHALAAFKVPLGDRGTVFYVPDFVDETTAVALLQQIHTVPKPKWTSLRNRRLQNWLVLFCLGITTRL